VLEEMGMFGVIHKGVIMMMGIETEPKGNKWNIILYA